MPGIDHQQFQVVFGKGRLVDAIDVQDAQDLVFTDQRCGQFRLDLFDGLHVARFLAHVPHQQRHPVGRHPAGDALAHFHPEPGGIQPLIADLGSDAQVLVVVIHQEQGATGGLGDLHGAGGDDPEKFVEVDGGTGLPADFLEGQQLLDLSLILFLQPGIFDNNAGLVGKGGEGIDVLLGQVQFLVAAVRHDQPDGVPA